MTGPYDDPAIEPGGLPRGERAERGAVPHDRAGTGTPTRRRVSPWTIGAVAAWALALAVTTIVAGGFPTAREHRLLFLMLGLVAVTVDNPRPWARFLRDWLPLLVILVGYDLVRSQAPSLLERAHVDPQRAFDEWLFFGTAPTVRLQRLLWTSGAPHAWDYLAWAVYLTHFTGAVAAAIVLWVRGRERFRRFALTILAMTLAGFLTYLVYPAVPPWLASEQGQLPHVVRVVREVWSSLGLGGIAKVFGEDSKYANPVGALPSLHAANPFLLMLFFWTGARTAWRRGALVAYTVAMAFTLVYTADHYVFDILMGWAYATVAFVAVGRAFDRWEARRATPTPPPEATAALTDCGVGA